MSIPPERISIKRRRLDDPVEKLYLELGSVHDSKRRFTDFCFHRLKKDVDEPQPTDSGLARTLGKQRSTRDNEKNGVPLVRETEPGDEIKDTMKLRATHRNRLEEAGQTNPLRKDSSEAGRGSGGYRQTQVPGSKSSIGGSKETRRFHLTRDSYQTLGPAEHGGIRKARPSRKSHVAVFVERSFINPPGRQVSLRTMPIDRIVEVVTKGDHKTQVNANGQTEEGIEVASQGSAVPGFEMAPPSGSRTGKSIKDPSSTWDHTSDQLADELAALAFEIDPIHHTSTKTEGIFLPLPTNTSHVMSDEDFVYDTYVRLPVDQRFESQEPKDSREANFGVLIIEDEDRELWETYAESDDDTEWDEEDADSNAEDNPANDYPEDEVSSDDEFGYNAYSHRRYASDEEEFDIKDEMN